MCLINDPKLVRKMLNRKADSFVFYKVLNRFGHRLISPYRATRWQAGTTVSNTERKGPLLTAGRVTRGIHVYTNRRAAIIDSCYREAVLVRVVCQKKDLLGAEENEAVFKEVYLSEKEYAKAMA